MTDILLGIGAGAAIYLLILWRVMHNAPMMKDEDEEDEK